MFVGDLLWGKGQGGLWFYQGIKFGWQGDLGYWIYLVVGRDGVLEVRRYYKFEEFFCQFWLFVGGGMCGNFDLQIVVFGEVCCCIVVFFFFNYVVGW